MNLGPDLNRQRTDRHRDGLTFDAADELGSLLLVQFSCSQDSRFRHTSGTTSRQSLRRRPGLLRIPENH
jgi:hypothetical protein